jgi:hypothetical protein
MFVYLFYLSTIFMIYSSSICTITRYFHSDKKETYYNNSNKDSQLAPLICIQQYPPLRRYGPAAYTSSVDE